jgi:hypothetical protein
MQKPNQKHVFTHVLIYVSFFSDATVTPNSPFMSDNWELIVSFVAHPNNYCVSVAPVLAVRELNY